MWIFSSRRRTLAWVSVAFVCTTTGAFAQSVSREPDTDRFGGDYAAFAVGDVGECQALCEGDARCKAFTFRKAAPVCWLKESAQAPSTDARYISGLKNGIPNLTVVSVNMAGHGVVNGLNWQTRVDRLGDDIAASGSNSRPDIISMTETEGWRWCAPGTGDTAGDYDFIDRLIARLTSRTGITYRVAYMVGNEGRFGAFDQCRYFSGDALLYNPARLVNRTPEDARRFVTTAHNSLLRGFQLRRSLPACNPVSARPGITLLIDGDPQTDKCGRSLPSGPAWTWIHGAPGRDRL